MRLVLDTNQAAEIQRTKAPEDCHPVIVIPPMTWAEVLSGPPDYATKRLRAVAQYDVQFGMELHVIYDRLRRLTEKEISSFDPVYPVGSTEHQYLLASLWSPHEEFVKCARQAKDQSPEFAANVEARFAVYKQERHVKKSRGESLERVKWANIRDAMQQLFIGPDAHYRREFVKIINKDGTVQLKTSSNESFFDAVLKNGPLRRFLFLQATVVFGYGDCWGDQEVNIGVSQSRDDAPDILMALYAREGDTILTNDKKLRRAFRHADPEEKVALLTWNEWLLAAAK